MAVTTAGMADRAMAVTTAGMADRAMAVTTADPVMVEAAVGVVANTFR
ncbi:hypothetical protein [Streptomyces sp. 1222.5]